MFCEPSQAEGDWDKEVIHGIGCTHGISLMTLVHLFNRSDWPRTLRKFRIRETLNLPTNADRSYNAIFLFLFRISEKTHPLFLLKIVSSQANIRNTVFNKRSPRPLEVGVSQRHKQTDGHGDYMTDPAQRTKPVRILYILIIVL